MKKIFFAVFAAAFLLVGCEKENPEGNIADYSIEGKWILEAYPNTMYILEDGIKYTYYCVNSNCDSLFATFEAGDTNALPSTNPYTFLLNDSLIIDMHFGNYFEEKVEFECSGNVINFNTQHSKWHRLGTNIDDCN